MGWTYRSLFLFEIVPDRGLWNTPGMGQAPQTLALEEWDVMMSWLSTFFFSGGRFMDECISNRFKMSSMFFEKNSWK
jgi:hypothetical protein